MSNENLSFLKWAGGKQKMAQHILSLLPQGQRLIEPFAGSLAVTLNSNFERCWAADINRDLITLYKILKTEGTAFIERVQQYFIPENNCKERYYQLRDHFNQCQDPSERAALFFYFNRHGYNGLCRYNKTGGFNVPFGHYKQPSPRIEALNYFSQRMQKAKITHGDFRNIMQQAKQGDVIYCDPPYVPLSDTAYFSAYSEGDFCWQDHLDLTELAQTCAKRGIPVLISNHDTPEIRELYSQAILSIHKVGRFISCKGEKRNKVSEILALFNH